MGTATKMPTNRSLDVSAHLGLMAEMNVEEEEEVSAIKLREEEDVSAIKLRYAFLDSIPKSMRAIRKHVENQMESDLCAVKRRGGVARNCARARVVGSWYLIRAACDVSPVAGVHVGAILNIRKNQPKKSRATPLVANSRAVTIWLARQTSECSYPIMAHTMGMNHSTLIHHFKKVDSQVSARSGILWDLLSDIFMDKAQCHYAELSREPKRE